MNAEPFGGVPYVGALFDSASGKPTTHFATAFVVTSKQGNMLMSAAHVLEGRTATSIIFAPGYTNGQAVHELWPIQKAYTDAAWQQQRSVNDDFCFLKVSANVQATLGSLGLATATNPQECQVIGYPDGLTGPVQATVAATWYKPEQQLTFSCNGFPNGTSGSPWIINDGAAFGLIGGFEAGGNSPAVSYSPYFGASLQALYATASQAFL
jgi:V8-like Glu-specific endopeptidase